MSFHDRSVAVIGAAGGIGSALCRSLAVEGVRLTLIGRDRQRLETLAAETGGVAVVCDAAAMEDLDSVLAAVEDLYGIVNCAGSLLLKPAHATTPAEFDQCISANLRTAFATVRAGVKAIGSREGSIVLGVIRSRANRTRESRGCSRGKSGRYRAGALGCCNLRTPPDSCELRRSGADRHTSHDAHPFQRGEPASVRLDARARPDRLPRRGRVGYSMVPGSRTGVGNRAGTRRRWRVGYGPAALGGVAPDGLIERKSDRNVLFSSSSCSCPSNHSCEWAEVPDQILRFTCGVRVTALWRRRHDALVECLGISCADWILFLVDLVHASAVLPRSSSGEVAGSPGQQEVGPLAGLDHCRRRATGDPCCGRARRAAAMDGRTPVLGRRRRVRHSIRRSGIYAVVHAREPLLLHDGPHPDGAWPRGDRFRSVRFRAASRDIQAGRCS